MKQFALMNEPIEFQLSIRLTNLITTYGTKDVRETLTVVSKEMDYDSLNYLDGIELNVKQMMDIPNIALHLNLTQTVHYFGLDQVKAYWNEVFTQKVA